MILLIQSQIARHYLYHAVQGTTPCNGCAYIIFGRGAIDFIYFTLCNLSDQNQSHIGDIKEKKLTQNEFIKTV